MDTTLLRRLEVESAAANLMHRYQALVDAKDVEGLAALATDDVELSRVQGDARGREAFKDLYRAFAASDVDVAQHMLTNLLLTPLGGERYQVDATFWVITTHESGGARQVWGRYRNDIVEVDGEWRLAAKRIRVAGVALVPEESLLPRDQNSFGPLPD
ncbi:nuclear transport factor 2 family protein [Nocardioides ochotonae]|uniref:nuclear transport factor 2 family protein n=1 Tax=Nocardioides ochotonae TaxID=2685869 RepID=UPI00140C9A14